MCSAVTTRVVTTRSISTITICLLLSSINHVVCNICIQKPDAIDIELNREYYYGTIANPLSGLNIKCSSSRNCHVYCSEDSACVETYVECSSPSCTITCTGPNACKQMEIKTINSPAVDILCADNFACLNSTISIVADNSVANQATIRCTIAESCHTMTAYSNGNTRMYCGSGTYSCHYTKLFVDSGTDNNVATYWECKKNHNTCSASELHVAGSGTGVGASMYCQASSGSSGDNCQYQDFYCGIDTFDCDVTGGNPYYASLDSRLFCKGGENTTCTSWGWKRWFPYATWTPYPTYATSQPTPGTLTPTYCPTVDPTIDPTNDPTKEPTKSPTTPTSDPTTDPTIEPTTDPTNADTCTVLGQDPFEVIDEFCDWCFEEGRGRGRKKACYKFIQRTLEVSNGVTQKSPFFNFDDWVEDQVGCFIDYCSNLDCTGDTLGVKDNIILKDNCGCEAFECLACESQCEIDNECTQSTDSQKCKVNDDGCNKCVECLDTNDCPGATSTCDNNVCGGFSGGSNQVGVMVAIVFIVIGVFGWI